MLVRLVLVMIVAPIFTGAVVIFGAISGLHARAYMKSQLPVKREQSKTRAPLIGHLNTTVASLGPCPPRDLNHVFWCLLNRAVSLNPCIRRRAVIQE